MVSLLNILDVGITILVPAVVWALLGVGVFQLIRDSGAQGPSAGRSERSLLTRGQSQTFIRPLGDGTLWPAISP